MKSFILLIQRKGFVATAIHGVLTTLGIFRSTVTSYWIRLRNVSVSSILYLGGSNIFFASSKNAITVGSDVRFGRCTRLDAGFGGKITIGDDVLIDDNCFITAQHSIAIGNHVQISAYTFITDFNHNFGTRSKPIVEQGCTSKPVVIGDDVWIGAHSCILSGVTIGKGAIVGAGAVVTKNVRPFTIVAGSPAREIGKRP